MEAEEAEPVGGASGAPAGETPITADDRKHLATLDYEGRDAKTARLDAIECRFRALQLRAECAEATLEEVSWIAERYVATDLAHDDPQRAVSIMAQMIDATNPALLRSSASTTDSGSGT